MDLQHHQLTFGENAILDTWTGSCFCGKEIQYSFAPLQGSATHHIFKLRHGREYAAAYKINVDRELILVEDEAMAAYNMLVRIYKGLFMGDSKHCTEQFKWGSARVVAAALANV